MDTDAEPDRQRISAPAAAAPPAAAVRAAEMSEAADADGPQFLIRVHAQAQAQEHARTRTRTRTRTQERPELLAPAPVGGSAKPRAEEEVAAGMAGPEPAAGSQERLSETLAPADAPKDEEDMEIQLPLTARRDHSRGRQDVRSRRLHHDLEQKSELENEHEQDRDQEHEQEHEQELGIALEGDSARIGTMAPAMSSSSGRRRRRAASADEPWAAAADEFLRALPAIQTYSESKRPTPFRDMRGWIETVSGERFKGAWDKFLAQLKPAHVADGHDVVVCRHILAQVVTDQVDPKNEQIRQTRQAVSNAIKRELKCHRELQIPGKGTTFRDVFREKCRLWNQKPDVAQLILSPLDAEVAFGSHEHGSVHRLHDHGREHHESALQHHLQADPPQPHPSIISQRQQPPRPERNHSATLAARTAFAGKEPLYLLTDVAETKLYAAPLLPSATKMRERPLHALESSLRNRMVASSTTDVRDAPNGGNATTRGASYATGSHSAAVPLAPRPKRAAAIVGSKDPRVTALDSPPSHFGRHASWRHQKLAEWQADLVRRGVAKDESVNAEDPGQAEFNPSALLRTVLSRGLPNIILQLLLDFRWIRSHVAVGGGVMSLVKDGYDFFLTSSRESIDEDLNWPTMAEREALRLIRNALVLSLPYITIGYSNAGDKGEQPAGGAAQDRITELDSSALATQLYGRLMGPSVRYPPIARLLQSIREYPTDGKPWLRPVNRCFDEPCADLRISIHAADVTVAEISPDGTLIAAVCMKHPDHDKMNVDRGGPKSLYEVKVWDVDTGVELATLFTEENVVRSLTFSPDGKWLVTLQYKSAENVSRPLKFWHMTRDLGRLAVSLVVAQIDVEQILSVAFSPDSTYVLGACTVSIHSSKIVRWRLQTGVKDESSALEVIRVPERLTLSHDGNFLAYQCPESSADPVSRFAAVCIYDTRPNPSPGSNVKVLCQETSQVFKGRVSLEVGPNSKCALLDQKEIISCVAFVGRSTYNFVTSGRSQTGSGDSESACGVVKVWSIASNRNADFAQSLLTKVAELKLCDGVTSVTSLTCPRLDTIVCGCDDGHVRVWSCRPGESHPTNAQTGTSDEQACFILGTGRVQTYKKSKDAAGVLLQDTSMYVSATEDGDSIVSTALDRDVVYVWDLKEYQAFTVDMWKKLPSCLAEAHWGAIGVSSISGARREGQPSACFGSDGKWFPIEAGCSGAVYSERLEDFLDLSQTASYKSKINPKFEWLGRDRAVVSLSSGPDLQWNHVLFVDRKRKTDKDETLRCSSPVRQNVLGVYNFQRISDLSPSARGIKASTVNEIERLAVVYDDDKFFCCFQLEVPIASVAELASLVTLEPDVGVSRKRLRQESFDDDEGLKALR